MFDMSLIVRIFAKLPDSTFIIFSWPKQEVTNTIRILKSKIGFIKLFAVVI